MFNSSFASFIPHALKGQKLLAQGQRPQAARPERAEALSPGQRPQAARPERAEALSPGQRPGLACSQTCRPVRAKALKLQGQFVKLLPLQGALQIGIIPRALPWAESFCPFRACCLFHSPGLRASALSGRAACWRCPGLRASALSGRAACWRCPGLRAFGRPSART